MPALSSTMTEGKITTWLKSPGDKVAKGESLVVVESDKADMEVESFSEGFLGAIVVDEGRRGKRRLANCLCRRNRGRNRGCQGEGGGSSKASNGASALLRSQLR